LGGMGLVFSGSGTARTEVQNVPAQLLNC
jgi:hypothetical protein